MSKLKIYGKNGKIFSGEARKIHGFFATKWRFTWNFDSGAVNLNYADKRISSSRIQFSLYEPDKYPVELYGAFFQSLAVATTAYNDPFSGWKTESVFQEPAYASGYGSVIHDIGQRYRYNFDVPEGAIFGGSGSCTIVADLYSPYGYEGLPYLHMQSGKALMEFLENLNEFPGRVQINLPTGINDEAHPAVKYPDAAWTYNIERIQ